MYLLDTNVVSTLAPKPREAHPELRDWIRSHHPDLFLSTITISELEAGVAKLVRQGATSRATMIATWIGAVLSLFGNRVLPFDTSEARVAGRLQDRAVAAGTKPGFADVAIAATASARGFTLLTRNVRHFALFGVKLSDPFKSLPSSDD
jgi:predicted nucleic acid-binding protein